MTTALEGIEVLDLTTGLPGAIATMVLRDNGARVVKVEPLSGDPQRTEPAFAQWHRGKESVAVDLATAEGRADVRARAATADVVVVSWRPGVAERLGLGYDELAAANPSLVYCSITGFGPKGPYAQLRGYEAIVGAKAGVMAYTDRPRFAAIPGASYGACHGALQGILSALYVRERTGRGQRVDTSLVQGLTAYDLYEWLGPQLQGESAAKPRAGFTFSSVAGMIAFTKDGRFLQFSNFRPHLVEAFLGAIGLSDWYRDAMERQTPPAEIQEGVLRRMHEKTLDEWMDIFMAIDDIGVEPFRTPMEALDHPQAVHNGNVLEVEDPDLGKTRQLGPLVRLAKTPSEPQVGAPRLGSPSPVETAPGTRSVDTGKEAPSKGPLEGVTVLELAWFYAAPFGTALLADLGARVIKVESAFGDPHRHQNPLDEYAGVKALCGKESIVVDYRTEEGRTILHQLAAMSDLVMRNYRQQNSVATGDDYDSLVGVNPDQVYLYAGAYGADGPFTTRPAFAPTMGVAAGQKAYQLGWKRALHHTEDITFEEGLDRLAAVQRNSGGATANADAAAALAVGSALLLGLVARQRHGTGQYLETSMLCSNAYVVSDEYFAYEGIEPRPHHDENGTGPLYRLYQVADGWVFLAAPAAPQWDALCAGLQAATGVELAGDARFATPADREANPDALATSIGNALAPHRAADLEAALSGYDVACAEVNPNPLSTFTITDPAMTENGFTRPIIHPLFGTVERHGPIVELSETPGVAGTSSLIGEHTRPILRELGYTEDAIEDLAKRQVIGWHAEIG